MVINVAVVMVDIGLDVHLVEDSFVDLTMVADYIQEMEEHHIKAGY